MKIKLLAAIDVALMFLFAASFGLVIYLMITDFALFIANTVLVLFLPMLMYLTLTAFEYRIEKHSKKSRR